MNDAEIALSWKMRCEELEAEVERLRAESEYNFLEAEKVPYLHREVERLRNRVHVLQGQLDDLAARAALAEEKE